MYLLYHDGRTRIRRLQQQQAVAESASLLTFLSNIDVVPFDADAARSYGEIRHALKSKGQLIGANDMLIAAHAKSLGYTLITNNTKEFERVEGLLLENWI